MRREAGDVRRETAIGNRQSAVGSRQSAGGKRDARGELSPAGGGGRRPGVDPHGVNTCAFLVKLSSKEIKVSVLSIPFIFCSSS